MSEPRPGFRNYFQSFFTGKQIDDYLFRGLLNVVDKTKMFYPEFKDKMREKLKKLSLGFERDLEAVRTKNPEIANEILDKAKINFQNKLVKTFEFRQSDFERRKNEPSRPIFVSKNDGGFPEFIQMTFELEFIRSLILNETNNTISYTNFKNNLANVADMILQFKHNKTLQELYPEFNKYVENDLVTVNQPYLVLVLLFDVFFASSIYFTKFNKFIKDKTGSDVYDSRYCCGGSKSRRRQKIQTKKRKMLKKTKRRRY